MNALPTVTQIEKVRRAHCDFCGGKGNDLQTEQIRSAFGVDYRVPLSHTVCKESILSLSLSLSLDEPADKADEEKES